MFRVLTDYLRETNPLGIADAIRLSRRFGTPETLLYYAQQRLRFLLPARFPYLLWTRHARFPLLCRNQSSDWSVFEQIFILRDYQSLDNQENVRFVVDCGANVGYSSAYFLSRFPKALVVSIEPHPRNCRVARLNLWPYGARSNLVMGAIWNCVTRLNFSKTPYRDSRDWAHRVEEGEVGDVQAIDIPEILRLNRQNHIDILKVDIEGAEFQLLKDDPPWLSCVNSIVVEIHDDTPAGPISPQIREVLGRHFTLSEAGELTIGVRT